MIEIDETEAAFQARVTQYAEEHGWQWMHIGRVGKYTANGAKGTLGTGWPDLLLLRGHRMLCVELKAQRAPIPTEAQRRVLNALALAGVETDVWRPSDWNMILQVLT